MLPNKGIWNGRLEHCEDSKSAPDGGWVRHERTSGEKVRIWQESFYCGAEPTARDSTSCAGYSPACNFALFLLIQYSYCLSPPTIMRYWLILYPFCWLSFSRNFMNFSSIRLSLERLMNFNRALSYYVAENIPHRNSVILCIIIYLIFYHFLFSMILHLWATIPDGC